MALTALPTGVKIWRRAPSGSAPLIVKLRIWIWTFGLAFVGYALAQRGSVPSPRRETVGAILGAAVGFCVGWGLQRLLEMGRRR